MCKSCINCVNAPDKCDVFIRVNQLISYVTTHDPLTGSTRHYRNIFDRLPVAESMEKIFEPIAESCEYFTIITNKEETCSE